MYPLIIQRDDGKRFYEDIVRLWDICLPGTPHVRFEWMSRGNPAGNAVWYLAFTHDRKELIGTASLMPKEFFHGVDKIRGAIVGDIMVQTAYQHKGVASQIQKIILGDMQTLGFSFLYVVPNSNSKNMLLLSGYSPCDRLDTFVRPVALEHYIKRKSGIYRRGFFPMLRGLMGLTGYGSSRRSGISFKWIKEFPEILGTLNIRDCEQTDAFHGDHNPSYLAWRYTKNPHAMFIALMMNTSDGRTPGYIIVTIQEKKLIVYDIVCLSKKHRDLMLIELVRYAERQGLIGIYIGAAASNPLAKSLYYKCYVSNGDRSEILMYGNKFLKNYSWTFFSADRNI